MANQVQHSQPWPPYDVFMAESGAGQQQGGGEKGHGDASDGFDAMTWAPENMFHGDAGICMDRWPARDRKGPNGAKYSIDAAVISDLCERYKRLSLSEEPAEGGEGVCRVGVRLPDGRRLQRRFLQGDSIRMLWPFCLQHLEEGGADVAAARGFHFILATPGSWTRLTYDSHLSFREADLSNSLLTLVWN